jgi:hypothetical protein
MNTDDEPTNVVYSAEPEEERRAEAPRINTPRHR